MSQPDHRIFIATEAAAVTVGGQEMALIPRQTTVRAGHPVLAKHPDWFRELVPDYEWPDGKTEPGAPRSAAAAGQRGARTR